MATIAKKPRPVEYPTSDGKPMAETDFHRILMTALIGTLEFWYSDDPLTYVSGNLLMYYVKDNKRKHVSPDVFVVQGVEKKRRLYFLTWEEGKTPNAVIELTSKSTRKEDTDTKFALYRDVLKVKEYFLFDPFGDYLKPDRLRGFRLRKREYVPISPVDGRLPSQVLELHLERDGDWLRLFDPASKTRLLTPDERIEHEKRRADDAEKNSASLAAENERLRKELEKLHRRNGA